MMTNAVENLVLEHLRALRHDVSEVRLDLRAVKSRLTAVGTQVATMNGRMDRFDERTARVELRLELRDA
ncbi:hypothetical protein [Methylobacterium sp. PvR107]|uniref:hypothetical protein n=1 Tax=Methylobacterium sp. PvR107 TaxID=2806597 RepID=UPI001AE139D8|nr:hypothetical protein [Methylobacterium sp. PvR107]MBP1179061.1 hypothetical protein [Methylobacterium sp. PvR107]